MQRIPEPELMNDPVQAAAYAAADFSDPHGLFIRKFQEVFPGSNITGEVLDLGCGPADISIRFARAYPACRLYGVDGSPAMLREAGAAIRLAGLEHRIELLQGVIPDIVPPRKSYQVILSNSLLHHLHQPEVLWRYLRKYTTAASRVFVMDLMRPDTIQDAKMLVNAYCEGESDVLRRDFLNSLCAAFLPEEVERQLETTGLHGYKVTVISDRHLLVYGSKIDAP